MGAEGLEEFNILSGSVVRITGRDARGAIGNLARDSAEGVPDAGATAILVYGSLNLVAINSMGVGKIIPYMQKVEKED